ncbi:hypothetical protein GCM10010430_58390 [Kitasatospora cystarginea]|uniref:DUF2993 domain-containing protein n=1 Tax=Kitasatospora cystarginea TaxID=58350 RepID=A0ABP5RPD4_9ACTN
MTAGEQRPLVRVVGPRHAAPRAGLRGHLYGKALAIAAVPTALLMGTVPTIAMADVQKDKACATAPDTVIDETPVPKSEITPIPDPTSTSTKAATPSEQPNAPTRQPTSAATPTTTPTATPTPTASIATTHPRPQQAVTANSPAPKADSVRPAGILDPILDPILHLGGHRSPTPTPTPSPRSTPTPTGSAAPAPTVTEPPAPRVPEAQLRSESPAASQTPAQVPSGSPSSGSPEPTATPSPSASPSKNPNCQVDSRGLAAAAAEPGHVVPEQNWTLHSSTLGLYGSKFYGVVDVHTATGTKRVLKFKVDRVDIGDLDMSTLEGNGMTFHVKGAPGSTSTMRGDEVTMYVERLSGHLSKILGLPIPIDLGEITLTPDTLPQWLYDLIGSIPIPLDLELKNVTAVQAGQFGGALHIPGMRMYNDNLPYGQ